MAAIVPCSCQCAFNRAAVAELLRLRAAVPGEVSCSNEPIDFADTISIFTDRNAARTGLALFPLLQLGFPAQ